MVKLILIGLLLNIVTVVMHSLGTDILIWLLRNPISSMTQMLTHGKRALPLMSTAGFLLCLHGCEILVWAIAYDQIVPSETLPTLEDAIYFSATTFTTTGYGDITLSYNLRLLAGMEAVNGILLCGWSTALLFAVVQKLLARTFKQKLHPLNQD